MTKGFPRGYFFLADQLNRAALSIAANTPVSVPVKPGQDGRPWKIWAVGDLGLLNVPPYVALSPDELLLPKEVLKK